MSNTKDVIVEQEARGNKSRPDRRLLVISLLFAFLCFVLLIVTSVLAYLAMKDQAESGTALAERVRAECQIQSKAAELGALCGEAEDVAESAPASVRGEKGEPGEPGPPPSDAQVALAVERYCAGDRCDGENATQAQVASAVALYCNARGECAGPRGRAGEDGEIGEQGPPPNNDQVSSAVATYCSTRNDCRGPAGSDGQPGKDGKDGSTGPTGVVAVDDTGCVGVGLIVDVDATYDEATRTIVMTCTYATNPGGGQGGGTDG